MTFMRQTKMEFEAAVKAFLKEYDAQIETAKLSLNTIFKPGDYPLLEALKHKFHFDTVVMPVPKGTMFEAEVESEEASKIRKDIEDQVAATFRQASRENWDRFYAVINRVQERLSDMLGFLDRMNVTGDEHLEKLRKQGEERLAGFSAKELNKNSVKKAMAVAQAAQIESSMAALMGGTAHAA